MTDTVPDEVAQKSALASAIHWGRYLPGLVFERRPKSCFFFDRGFLERRGLMEALANWSFSSSADDVLVSLGHSRQTGEFEQQFVRQSFRRLSRGGVDGELERLRAEWGREQPWASGTALVSTPSQDWMLYEDHLEEVGVLALFSASLNEGPNFQQFLDGFFFSVRDIEDQLSGKDPSQNLTLLFNRDFLQQLLQNFSSGGSGIHATATP